MLNEEFLTLEFHPFVTELTSVSHFTGHFVPCESLHLGIECKASLRMADATISRMSSLVP